MSRPGQALRRVGGTLAAVSGVLAGLTVRDLTGVLAVVVILVVAVCWVIADTGRTRRLATLIGACRGSRPQPAGTLP